MPHATLDAPTEADYDALASALADVLGVLAAEFGGEAPDAAAVKAGLRAMGQAAEAPAVEPVPAADDAEVAKAMLIFKAGWSADLHPRGDDGRFIDAHDLHEAQSNPAKAAELRAKVTKPEERAKLDEAIGAEKPDATPAPDAPSAPVQKVPAPQPGAAGGAAGAGAEGADPMRPMEAAPTPPAATDRVPAKPWELPPPSPGETRGDYVARTDARVPRAKQTRKPTDADIEALKHDLKYVEKMAFPPKSGLRIAVRRNRDGTVRVNKVGKGPDDSIFTAPEYNAVSQALRKYGYVSFATGKHAAPIDYDGVHGGALTLDANGRHPDYADEPDLRGRDAPLTTRGTIEATGGASLPQAAPRTDYQETVRNLRPSGVGDAWTDDPDPRRT